MTSSQPPSLEHAKVIAALAGLPLNDDELAELLPGLARSQTQTVALRTIIARTDEPAAVFNAASGGR